MLETPIKSLVPKCSHAVKNAQRVFKAQIISKTSAILLIQKFEGGKAFNFLYNLTH